MKQIEKDKCQGLIESLDLLTLKMEFLLQEYFEVNVDFISKITAAGITEDSPIAGTLPSYQKRFKMVLNSLEQEILVLKREKVNMCFRQRLMMEKIS